MGITVKEIANLVAKGFTLEDQQKIMEMHEENLALRESVLALKTEVRDLTAQLNQSRDLVFRKPAYWLINSENEMQSDGPFCQVCWDKDKKQIRLQGTLDDFLNCGVCDGCWAGPNYVEPNFENTTISEGSWMSR